MFFLSLYDMIIIHFYWEVFMKQEYDVSIYDLLPILGGIYRKALKNKENNNRILENKVRNSFGINYGVSNKYDYEKNELEVVLYNIDIFDPGFAKETEKYICSKADDAVFIKDKEIKSSSDHSEEFLQVLGKHIVRIIDYYNEFREYNHFYNYGIKSTNTQFLVNLNDSNIELFDENNDRLIIATPGKDRIIYVNTYANSKEMVKEFKNVRINTKDCPNYLLHELKQDKIHIIDDLSLTRKR